jgi:hypothetical protein
MDTSLTKAELTSLCTGWSGATWRGAHDTMEAVGGAAAGWLAHVWSPKVALAIGLPLTIVNAFMGAHPVVRLFTSVGPGMVAGANAVMVKDWLTVGSKANLRAVG